MPKSKLGVFVISLNGIDILDYVQHSKPRVILSMDHSPDIWRQVKQISPNTFLLGRHYLEDGEQLFDQPELRAQQLFDKMRPDAETMRGIYDAWMGYNESVIDSDDAATRLSQFYVKWGQLMRSAALRSAAYSFSTGTPAAGFPNSNGIGNEPNYWTLLADGVRACDYLSLHEYSAPTLQTLQNYLMLRYRQAWASLPDDAHRPILITECGLDGGVIAGGGMAQKGWTYFTNEDGYLGELQWYDNELLTDDYVVGATIFTLNAWGTQNSFSIGSANKIRDFIGLGGTPTAPPLPPLTLQDAVIQKAQSVGWMPVNNTAALWKYAKLNGLQDQQSDEIHFTYKGSDYIAQVFNLGIVYVKVGDWGNIHAIPK